MGRTESVNGTSALWGFAVVVSTLAWVDTSEEDQRRIRELLAQFAQPESRDELGIGQIRDALSDLLFPGTSVIQTRARYFLFVPWIFRQGERRRRSGSELRKWTENRERRFVETLRAVAGDAEGLIGRRSGPAVKTLPSTIYWTGLLRFGILTRDVAADQLPPPSREYEEADELAGRIGGNWHPTLPPEPQGFPDTVESAFDLSNAEASWLSERILDAAPDTLLAHLLSEPGPPDADSATPWVDLVCSRAPEPVRTVLRHGQLFSLAMHGAALLYNLLVSEHYEEAGYTQVEHPVDDYRELLAEWHVECERHAHQLATWDRAGFWDCVRTANVRIGGGTTLFVDRWLDATAGGRTATAATDEDLRSLISTREQVQKRRQSRLSNERLLRTWSGRSGTDPLTYRWPRAHRIVTDIHEGLARDAGS